MPHTPGPWINNGSHWIDARNRTRIAEVYNWAPGYSDNANLIAAAPQLLEALEDLLASNPEDHEWQVAQARIAVDRAKGAR